MTRDTGVLVLTSTGLSNEVVAQEFKSFVVNPADDTVAIVTTASEGKEQNKYSQLAKEQLIAMGFRSVEFVDFETDAKVDLSSYKVFYVCGGNTFKLLKYAREANFKTSVEQLLNRGGVYIGVSAGSIIVGPSISIADEVEPDPNDVGLKDLAGFDITDVIVCPHYIPRIETEVQAFEAKHSVIVERLTDSQAIILRGSSKEIVG